MEPGADDPGRPRLGVSACLLGQPVRYDGGHKLDRWITEELGRLFELVPFCPEAEVGLGTPRPPVQLVEVGEEIRVQGVGEPGLDVTRLLRGFHGQAQARIAGLCGFVLKAGSPSCGLDVDVFDHNSHPTRRHAGVFAAAVVAADPELPVEQEDRLRDPKARAGFVAQALACHRLRQQGTPHPG